jgi:ribonuclease HII
MLRLREEQRAWKSGYNLVGGMDEAGRGPLAGPVVAACVAIGPASKCPNALLKRLKDSKMLTPRRREEIFNEIIAVFNNIGIGIADHSAVDRLNVLGATWLAMRRAVRALPKAPDYILVDGLFTVPRIKVKQKAIVHGDRQVATIAAASIVAKVTRDRIMERLHKRYPVYNFQRHKGYGTKEHLAMLKKYGPCPIHRLTFAPVARIAHRVSHIAHRVSCNVLARRSLGEGG